MKRAGRRWARLSRLVRERDNYACRQCGKWGKEVDHITPVKQGGGDDMGNLQVLCAPCHKAKTRREVTGHIRGRVEWLDRLEDDMTSRL